MSCLVRPSRGSMTTSLDHIAIGTTERTGKTPSLSWSSCGELEGYKEKLDEGRHWH